jgi:hypothetical protein
MNTDDHSPSRDDENSRQFPSLRLVHSELHAPTYRAIDSDHRLYDLAAWVFCFQDHLRLSIRAPLMAALARAWPHPRGRRRGVRAGNTRSGTRLRTQWAHYLLEKLNLTAEQAAPFVGLSPARTKREVHAFRGEADAEQAHAAANEPDEYGIPRVEIANPYANRPEDVPNTALLDPGWWGQMMLADNPHAYRARLHHLLKLHKDTHEHETGSAKPPPLERRHATFLWDKLAGHEPPTTKEK